MESTSQLSEHQKKLYDLILSNLKDRGLEVKSTGNYDEGAVAIYLKTNHIQSLIAIWDLNPEVATEDDIMFYVIRGQGNGDFIEYFDSSQDLVSLYDIVEDTCTVKIN